jgi:hypothetical protein
MSPRKNPGEQPETIKVSSAIVLSPIERLATISLLAFGMLPIIVLWIRLATLPEFNERQWIDFTILGIFAFVAIETLSLIALRGFQRVDLSDGILKWLGAAALVDVGGLTWYVVKHMQ